MKIALDTNIIVELLRGGDVALKERYLSRSPIDYMVPEMVRAELLFGAALSGDPERHGKLVSDFLKPLRLIPFGGEACEQYAEIRHQLEKKGEPIGPNDLVIAATVRAEGATLVTRNTREFLRIHELAVEEW